jgi:hypothetical protein
MGSLRSSSPRHAGCADEFPFPILGGNSAAGGEGTRGKRPKSRARLHNGHVSAPKFRLKPCKGRLQASKFRVRPREGHLSSSAGFLEAADGHVLALPRILEAADGHVLALPRFLEAANGHCAASPGKLTPYDGHCTALPRFQPGNAALIPPPAGRVEWRVAAPARRAAERARPVAERVPLPRAGRVWVSPARPLAAGFPRRRLPFWG